MPDERLDGLNVAILVADGFEFHIPRDYICFAMAFAGAVEVFNVIATRNRRRRRAAKR